MDRNEMFEKSKHLPQPLRDFHDQKDVFKSFHAWFEPHVKPNDYKMPNWVEGQIYTIDYFLKFMALHGWTLQRSRYRTEFFDLDQTIKERKDQELESLRQILGDKK